MKIVENRRKEVVLRDDEWQNHSVVRSTIEYWSKVVVPGDCEWANQLCGEGHGRVREQGGDPQRRYKWVGPLYGEEHFMEEDRGLKKS